MEFPMTFKLIARIAIISTACAGIWGGFSVPAMAQNDTAALAACQGACMAAYNPGGTTPNQALFQQCSANCVRQYDGGFGAGNNGDPAHPKGPGNDCTYVFMGCKGGIIHPE